MMIAEQIERQLKLSGIDVHRVELLEGHKVLFRMTDATYSRALMLHDFDDEELRAAMENVVGMARTYHVLSGGAYEFGFSGDIAETRAREAAYLRTERIAELKWLIARVPEWEAELAQLEANEP